MILVSLYGTSPNAVKSQVWIAISVYMIVAMIKKILKIELKLYTILQISRGVKRRVVMRKSLIFNYLRIMITDSKKVGSLNN